MPHTIFVAGTLHTSGLEELKNIPHSSVIHRPQISTAELLTSLGQVEVLVTRSGTTVDRELLDAAPQLKVLARAGVGIGNIDLSYATEKGVLVVNAPGQNTQSAAEITFALLLAMMRKLPEAWNSLKSGNWNRHHFAGTQLHGKTLGIVGLGHVGRRVAVMAQGFGMMVQAYDPYLSEQVFEDYRTYRQQNLMDLLASSQILSLHVPLNEETRSMITKQSLLHMPRGSWVLNTARGGVIPEQDLYDVLESEHIAACALDTWENEPTPRSDLTCHPRVYGTPHIGAITEEAQIAVGKTIALQVRKALAGDVVDHPVNIPGLHSSLSSAVGSYMVLAEKLACLALQISTFVPQSLSLDLPDTLEAEEQKLLYLALKKGYMSRISEDFVSYANASRLFAAQGLTCREDSESSSLASSSLRSEHHRNSSLKLHLWGSAKKHLSLGGVVYDGQHLRLTSLNEFNFEVIPEGHFIVFKNEDQPGVVGSVGQFLAQKNVNIHSFYLSANQRGGKAMAMVKINAPLSTEDLAALQKTPLITELFRVEL